MKKTYLIKEKVWLYPGMAGHRLRGSGSKRWHFVTIPQDEAKDINYFFSMAKRGWGSLRVLVTLGSSSWKTSIFPDKKSDSYLLPLKSEVRKKENIKAGDTISFQIELEY